MSTLHTIRAAAAPPEPPQRSQERQKLADAISRLRSAEAYYARVGEARRIQDDRRFDASCAVDAAADALREAKGETHRWLVDAVLAVDGVSPVAAAERALAEANTALELERHKSELLLQEERRAETNLRQCQDSVRWRAGQAYEVDPAVAARRAMLEDAQVAVLRRQRATRRDFDALREALEADADAVLPPEV